MTIEEQEEIGYHRRMALSRFVPDEFVGPTIVMEKPMSKSEHIGHVVKLDLTEYEHSRLIAWLKRGSYDPAIRSILYQVIGVKDGETMNGWRSKNE